MVHEGCETVLARVDASPRMRVAVARRSAGDARRRESIAAECHAPDPTEILGGLDDFAPASHQAQNLDTGASLEVDVVGGADVGPPAVFRVRQAGKHLRGVMAVHQQDARYGIGTRVPQILLRQLLPDQRPDGIGSAAGIPESHPTVQRR